MIKDLEFLAGIAVDLEEARALDLARQVASITARGRPWGSIVFMVKEPG